MDPVGGAFSLVDHFGAPAPSARFLGRPALLYFGFTHCRVVCPRALARLSAALDRVDAHAAVVQPLFVSVDPDRDTPAVMRAYLETHHPRFLGLTGSRDAVEAMKTAYKVFARRVDDGDDPDGYTVSHTAFSYLVGSDGRYLTHFPDTFDATMIADRMRERLFPDRGAAED